MKGRQPGLRAIPQFDCGQWKLRLERVPVDPDNETTIGTDFDSPAQSKVGETDRARSYRYQSSTTDANHVALKINEIVT